MLDKREPVFVYFHSPPPVHLIKAESQKPTVNYNTFCCCCLQSDIFCSSQYQYEQCTITGVLEILFCYYYGARLVLYCFPQYIYMMCEYQARVYYRALQGNFWATSYAITKMLSFFAKKRQTYFRTTVLDYPLLILRKS